MNLESQVVPLPMAKRLKELGVNQPCVFYWSGTDNILVSTKRGDWTGGNYATPLHRLINNTSCHPAYTVAELLEQLPAEIEYKGAILETSRLRITKGNSLWFVYYEALIVDKADLDTIRLHEHCDSHFPSCLCCLYIHLLENKIITA